MYGEWSFNFDEYACAMYFECTTAADAEDFSDAFLLGALCFGIDYGAEKSNSLFLHLA